MRVRFIFVLLLVSAVCGSSVMWAEGADASTTSTFSAANTFILKESAVVSDTVVRIRDIALMDNNTRQRIGNLAVAVSPEPGKTNAIERKEIYEKLVGNGIGSPQLKGASRVKIIRRGTTIHPSFFKDRVLQYILTHSRWKEGVSVQIVSSKPMLIPEDGVRWELTPANGQDFFGNLLFKVRALSGSTGEELFSNWLVAKLTIRKRVAISNRTLQKGQSIGVGEIRWEVREITPFTKGAILSERALFGQRAGRIIRTNSVITSGLLMRHYMVKRGSLATLNVNFNGIKATSRVKVLKDGAMGDTIQVMNTDSRKILAAVVTGQNKLEVPVQ